MGVFAPAATPANVVSRLNADIEKLLSNADFRERLAALAWEPVGGSPQSFARYIESEIVRWAGRVRRGNRCQAGMRRQRQVSPFPQVPHDRRINVEGQVRLGEK